MEEKVINCKHDKVGGQSRETRLPSGQEGLVLQHGFDTRELIEDAVVERSPFPGAVEHLNVELDRVKTLLGGSEQLLQLKRSSKPSNVGLEEMSNYLSLEKQIMSTSLGRSPSPALLAS